MNWALIVKKLRKKLILSQTEFAELLGISFGTINRWENGKYEPTIKMKRELTKLCKKNKVNNVLINKELDMEIGEVTERINEVVTQAEKLIEENSKVAMDQDKLFFLEKTLVMGIKRYIRNFFLKKWSKRIAESVKR